MLVKKILDILVCPETHQPLHEASKELLKELNEKIERGVITNKKGMKVLDTIEEGLLRKDGMLLYPIKENIPLLVIEEGILLNPSI